MQGRAGNWARGRRPNIPGFWRSGKVLALNQDHRPGDRSGLLFKASVLDEPVIFLNRETVCGIEREPSGLRIGDHTSIFG